MNVLIGCEESGRVRRAFRGRGHVAWSCDLLPARDRSPHHYEFDVNSALRAGEWELAILHPPCQYMAVSGNRWHSESGERAEAIEWTRRLAAHAAQHCKRVCIEQPISVLDLSDLGYSKTFIQPWQFGHPETKKTTLWLWYLLPLEPTDIVEPTRNRIHRMPPGPNRSRDRSETYLGVADAMADQWGNL